MIHLEKNKRNNAQGNGLSTIKEIMLVNPPFLYIDNSVKHARIIFGNSRFESLPVINKSGRLVGILDQRVVMQEHLPAGAKVENYISSTQRPLKEYDPISVLADFTPETPILPVVSVNNNLVGMIPNPGFIKDVLNDVLNGIKTVAEYSENAIGNYGLMIINDDGEIILFNYAAEKILGMQAKDIYKIHVNKVLYDSKLCEVVKKGHTYFKAKMHAEQAILCTNRFPLYKGEVIAGAMGIFEDISEQERLNERLKRLRRLNLEMVGILEAINDGIVVLDNNGVVLRANSAFEALSGLSANQILGMNCEYLHEQGCFRSVLVWRVMEMKKPLHVIENINGRDYLFMAKPLFDTHGKLAKVIVIMKDIFYLNELILNLQVTQEVASRYCRELLLPNATNEQDDMVAKSFAMRRVFSLANKVAKVDSNVLITGETGVGKELVARSIHKCSQRMNGPFIKLNCGAIPEHLLESELFGYESGAFTGAKKEGKAGLIELADGGTLFLDEVGDLPMNLQVKLLRVLQEREVMRVGGTKHKKVDFRLVAATNQDLEKMVKQQCFREDLFYRLNVIPVVIPPLRERKEDIVPLIIFFLNKFNKKYGFNKKISPETIQSLLRHDWPGNIRELENTVERLIVTSDTDIISPSSLDSTKILAAEEKESKVMSEVMEKTEKELLIQALEQCRTTREMAEALGISQSAVVKKMKKYGISKSNRPK